jgi:hypothetical protein
MKFSSQEIKHFISKHLVSAFITATLIWLIGFIVYCVIVYCVSVYCFAVPEDIAMRDAAQGCMTGILGGWLGLAIIRIPAVNNFFVTLVKKIRS